jgi:threonine dehydrogenase-like Zn-dependent dehydrogenase
MSKMRAVQVSRPNGPFEIVGRDIPEPDSGSVGIKVQACGICHSDSVTKDGASTGATFRESRLSGATLDLLKDRRRKSEIIPDTSARSFR